MQKIDVVINVYGKPYQTLCTLKSLMQHSGQHIDKIYFIEEREQPYMEKVSWVAKQFKNVVHYVPKRYAFMQADIKFQKKSRRYTIRYQYGIEQSDKTFVFITHNDVLYTGDIIGEMLEQIGTNAGIGQIGQCWNCPASAKGYCNGETYHNYKPSYEEVVALINNTPSPRTSLQFIDKNFPTPLPECRLNEWACMINREIVLKECKPIGDGPLFGLYDIIDLGVGWFRDMNLKGYSFKNYEQNFKHGYWAAGAGYPNQLNAEAYRMAEKAAEHYYHQYFNSQ
ncbi:MAG: hypothetical protein K2X48_05995 [Chitinophagaceae bacterium]|nr:hypothetical protein [Chitinophagaceae bacterium]